MELSNKNIDAAVEEIRAFFEKSNVPRKDVLKICLVAEEVLLRCQDHFGEAHDFKLYTKKFFTAPKIIIRVKGEQFFPPEIESDETILSNAVMRRLLNFDDADTAYRYENGRNEITFFSTRGDKKLKIPGGAITVAILAAIIFSVVVNFLSPEIQTALLEQIVNPVLSTLLKLIVTVTVVMIFISITSSICAIEDSATLESIGSTVVGRFFLIDVFIVALTIFIGLIFFPWK